MKDPSFDESMNPIELSAWLALKSVIVSFLGNYKSSEYQKMIEELMENFRNIVYACQWKLLFSFSSGLLPWEL